jgi:hypothetical protein
VKHNNELNRCGRWWEKSSEYENIIEYIEELERKIEKQEKHIENLTTRHDYITSKSAAVIEFLKFHKELLTPAEFVFYLLRFAQYKYSTIEAIMKSMPRSDSSIQRIAKLAKNKIEAHSSKKRDGENAPEAGS